MKPGQRSFGPGPIVVNAGRRVTQLQVTNTSDHTVQVSSHFHFFETNRRLDFDRDAAYGLHLDLPAGRSVRFAPGQALTVDLVPYAGRGRAEGFSGLSRVREAGD